jgi:hypothetical protein
MSRTEPLPRTHPPVEARRRRVVIGLPDALIAVALGAIAFVVRRHVPADGLFYDDAWQAFGAWKGSPSELITVGQTQPGFTAGLMAWTRVFGMGTASVVAPALIAGTLGPPLLYVALRRFGYVRSIAFLAGAALTSAEVHIAYSYHVKTYTFDVLIVLGLALAVRHLAPLRWTTATAAAWCIGAVAVGSFSSIALIGTAVAGVVLVLHPSGDRKLRASAVAVQLAALGALYLASSRTYNYKLLHGFFAMFGYGSAKNRYETIGVWPLRGSGASWDGVKRGHQPLRRAHRLGRKPDHGCVVGDVGDNDRVCAHAGACADPDRAEDLGARADRRAGSDRRSLH